MRKTLWTLGTLGVLGLALTVSTAQDRIGTNHTATTKGGYTYLGKDGEKTTDAKADASAGATSNSKFTRTRNATAPTQPNSTGLKNYNKELFGSGAPGASGAAAKSPTRDGDIQQTSGINKPATGTIRQAGGLMNDDSEEGGLTQADFATDKSKPAPIKQVSGSKAPSLPDLDEGPLGGNEASSSKLMLLPDVPPKAGNNKAPAAAPAAKVETPKAKPTNLGTNVVRDGKKVELTGRATGGISNFTPDSPRVTTQWSRLSELNVGQPCSLELAIKNEGGSPATDVVVDAYFPRSIRITDANPEPNAGTDKVTWNFKTLPARAEQRIRMTVIPSERGELAANANVRFTSAASTVFAVEEPQLKIALSGAQQVSIGDPVIQQLTVSNPGTGIAHNVEIKVQIPEGLEHASGTRELKLKLGSLIPGETKPVKLSLVAKRGGLHSLKVDVQAGTELRQAAVSRVEVLTPSLKLNVSGPATRYVGREARYTINVKNDGEAVTTNVRTVYVVPKGFSFTSASSGGVYDESTRTVTWFDGSIDAGKTTELSVKLVANEQGEFAHVAKVLSEHGGTAESKVATKVEGSASLQLEVVDVDDPVEVGRETAYEVRIKNVGTKDAQNIGLSLELPNAIQLLDVKAPVSHLAESGLLVFKALPSLAAGKSAIFHIAVKGKDEGIQRLRARLTSDSIQEPLTIEEVTKFYAD